MSYNIFRWKSPMVAVFGAHWKNLDLEKNFLENRKIFVTEMHRNSGLRMVTARLQTGVRSDGKTENEGRKTMEKVLGEIDTTCRIR